MHAEVRRTKAAGIKVTNVETGTEERGIIGFLSREGYCVWTLVKGCKRDPPPGTGKPRASGMKEDTSDRQRGHRGRTGTDVNSRTTMLSSSFDGMVHLGFPEPQIVPN